MPEVDPTYCPTCGGIKDPNKDVCNWCSGEPISLGTYVEVGTFYKVHAQLQAAQEKLALATKMLEEVNTFAECLKDFPDFSWRGTDLKTIAITMKAQIAAFLTTSQTPGLVVVKREDLEEITNFYNFVRDDVLATFDQDKAYDRLKAALEGKEEGK